MVLFVLSGLCDLEVNFGPEEVVIPKSGEVVFPKPSLSSLMSLFNIQAKNPLSSAPAYWEPLCEVVDLAAVQAIARASTDTCKREMNRVACLARQNILFPDNIPRYKYFQHNNAH